MEKDTQIDFKAMQERIDEENKKKSEQFHGYLNALGERRKQQRDEVNNLFAKAMLSEHEETEKERAVKIEKEKANAIKEVEKKFEHKGVKSEHTKQIDEAYRSLVKNLPGLNDE